MTGHAVDTGFGTVYGDRPILSLADYAFFQEGPGLRDWQWTGSGMKVVNGRNILPDGSIDLSNTVRYISVEEYETRYSHFAVEDGDTLVTSSGTIGKVARAGPKHLPLMMNTSVIRFHPKDPNILNADYLHSYLRSPFFQNQAAIAATGAAQPNFGPIHIKQIKLVLPLIELQRVIAYVLSAYDHLIENNLRRIKILEDMAQSLYREWFVDFRFPGRESVKMVDSPLGMIPEGW